VRRTATRRRPARPLGRRRCSEPRSRSQPAGRHALAVSSEGALRLRCSASSVACASEFKPLYRRESVRESEPREIGQGFRVPVCACAGIGVYARVLGPTQLSSNCHRSETCSLRNQRRIFLANTARSLAAAVGRVARARRDDRAGSEARSRGMRPSRRPLRCYCWSCSSRKQWFQPKDKRTCVAIATKNKAKFTNNLVLAANGLCLAFVACVSLGSHIRGVPPCARATLKETWSVN